LRTRETTELYQAISIYTCSKTTTTKRNHDRLNKSANLHRVFYFAKKRERERRKKRAGLNTQTHTHTHMCASIKRRHKDLQQRYFLRSFAYKLQAINLQQRQ